jgi:cobalt-zinc-cadmium efflux system membrane fusion protein
MIEQNSPRLSLAALRRRPALVALAIALPTAAASVWAALAPAPAPAAVVAPPKAGSFKPTPAQMAMLKIQPAPSLSFQDTIVTDGSIAYDDDATTPVYSPYSGRVTRLMAKLGDVVRRGAPLMAVAAAEVVQNQSDVATARAARDTALAVEERQKQLYEAGAGALKDWRQAQSDRVAADAALAAARGRLQILGKSATEIDALEQAPATGTEAVLTAPISGTVIQRQVGLGQYIASAATGASTPVYTIGNLGTVWLLANLREADAAAVRVGQAAEITLAAFPGEVFKANIAWVAPGLDQATHRLPVRAVVRNPDGRLKPQMLARFSIATGSPRQSAAVPESAVVYEGDAAKVYVAQDDGSVAARAIRTGARRSGMIEATSGLRAGEKIVTAGTLFIDRAAEAQ